MIYTKVDAMYIEDLDVETDVVEWFAPVVAAEPPVVVPPDPQ